MADDDPFASFETTCPRCGEGGNLCIISLDVRCEIPLETDGFSLIDSKFLHTFNEKVWCKACDAQFWLDEVTL